MINPTTNKMIHNSVLTETERRELIAEIRWAAGKQLNARQYLPVKKIPANKFSIRVWTGEHMSDAKWAIGGIPEQNQDVVEVTASNPQLVGFAKGFSVNEGNDVPEFISRNSRDCGLQCKELENQYITTGLKNIAGTYATGGNGMLAKAGNSFTTTADFATAGKGLVTVAGALALMRTDSIMGPYFMAVNEVQYGQLESSVFTGGVDEMRMCNDILSLGRSTQRNDRIFVNPDMPAGSGMIWSRNPIYAELVIGYDLTERSALHIDGKEFKIIMSELVDVKDVNSICLLNDI